MLIKKGKSQIRTRKISIELRKVYDIVVNTVLRLKTRIKWRLLFI